MKTLFKLTMAVGLVGLLALSASAQNFGATRHLSQSFLGDGLRALQVTNTLAITNLYTAGSVGTNTVGTIWTNADGRRITAAAGNAYPLLRDVRLPFPPSGRRFLEATNGNLTYQMSDQTISVTMVGGSGANVATTFVMTPIYNGKHEATASGEEWTFQLTPTTTTLATLQTNVPLHRWPGAAGLRCRRIVAGDTDASSQIMILDFSLNGPSGP